jgi:hypothetical protein
MIRWALLVVAACESDRTPPPTPIVPTPIDAASPDATTPDAPPLAADLQCYFNGAKEYIRIKTDLATMTGLLERITTGPVPDRTIKYRVVADSQTSFELVFQGYGPGDNQRTGNRPSPKREVMTAGKSVIARVASAGSYSRIYEREVDLHTGMQHQTADHSFPCNEILDANGRMHYIDTP